MERFQLFKYIAVGLVLIWSLGSPIQSAPKAHASLKNKWKKLKKKASKKTKSVKKKISKKTKQVKKKVSKTAKSVHKKLFKNFKYFKYAKKAFLKHNAQKKNFSWTSAYLMGLASCVVYYDRKKAQEIMSQMGFKKFYWFSHKNTQAFVATHKKMILVSFRGSEPTSIKDFISDVNIKLIQKFGGRVHKGFYDNLSYVWGPLWKQIQKSSKKGKRSIWLTGHSMGASLAILAASHLREKKVRVKGVYTYGQPRVGDQAYNKHIRAPLYRVVMREDPMVYFPPKSKKIKAFHFVHSGKLYLFNTKGRYDSRVKKLPKSPTLNVFKGVKKHGIHSHITSMYNQLPSSLRKKWPKPF